MTSDLRKVCDPLLPTAQEIMGYLDVPDRNRWYANRGELVQRLETRLSKALGADRDVVTTAASGTAALEASIMATAGRATAEKPLALLPSYTFAATALAADRCGYTPYFVDVDPQSWALDPAALADHPVLAQAGVVLVVAPYGRLPDLTAFEVFRDQSGVPVVVDAAAAFEAVLSTPVARSSSLPICLSFHATKTFSTGEGGAVVWDTQPGRELISQATNFGFLNSRECRMSGFNGKMSEYHAAVGHAMLDMYARRAAAYAEVSRGYRAAFDARDVPGRLFVSPEVSSAYALLEAEDRASAEHLHAVLSGASFGWRRWYEHGLHNMAHFAACPRDPLPVTEDLGLRLFGLPMAPDLAPSLIADVAACVAPVSPPISRSAG
ncbi:DegT/DnrJ/EryC1/StrS family aminotransferase [Dinoroseobacter sp. S124A]|uniref:DegT/DnrJ/EryC1/StrS family aminotransferase n=1 Tax=Dinoroseobacter sp. S124A TaxID=3415128 RepID=UPI003C799091